MIINELLFQYSRCNVQITRTCRENVRAMYPNKAKRAKKSVKLMDKKIVEAIRGNYKVIYHNSVHRYL